MTFKNKEQFNKWAMANHKTAPKTLGELTELLGSFTSGAIIKKRAKVKKRS